MASPEVPNSFRTDRGGGGALNDLGSHIISMARYLVGPFAKVSASLKTVHTERPVASDTAEKRPVEVDDLAHTLVRFENGAAGSIEANWAASGRTMDLSFEVTGTRGSIHFSQEHMNELHVWTSGSTPGRAGYTRLETGPNHPPYGQFCPAPGHRLGFNDLKVIEVAELLDAYATGSTGFPDFAEATLVQHTIDAIKKGRFGRLLARCVTGPACRPMNATSFIEQAVPCMITSADDLLIGLEDRIGEMCLAQDLPDILDRVEFRRAWRQDEHGTHRPFAWSSLGSEFAGQSGHGPRYRDRNHGRFHRGYAKPAV